jgi:hypothetical protein
MNACADPRPEREVITFRVVGTPAGWRIVGVDSLTMSTLYLSREHAVGHAREMAQVMMSHGQPVKVLVEGEDCLD